jgi:hypothetical protein
MAEAQGWFYQHGNETHGPIATDAIKELARQGLLTPTDLLWPEGSKIEYAIEAQAALDFSSLGCIAAAPPATPDVKPSSKAPVPVVDITPTEVKPAEVGLPDWLADVQKMEGRGPSQPATPSSPPEWLEDLRLWIGLDLYSSAPQAPEEPIGKTAPPPPVPAEGLPAWLESWKDLPPEKPTKKPIGTGAAPTVPLAIPVAPGRKKPSPPRRKTLLSESAEVLSKEAIAETGFDPQTGQILDQVKFSRWKKQSARTATAGAVSNESMFEAFRRARVEIQNWVDHENNRVFMELADMDTILSYEEVKKILDRYESYGMAMQEKLIQHLEFMVDNRKKFYAAQAENQ